MEGTYHSWTEPPAIVRNGRIVKLHPGDDYNCRCWAEACWDPAEAENKFVDMVGGSGPKNLASATGGTGRPDWTGPEPWKIPSSSYMDFDRIEPAEGFARSYLVDGPVSLKHLSDMKTVNLVTRALHDLVVDRGMPKIQGLVTQDFRSLSAYAFTENGKIVFPTAGWNGAFVRDRLLRSSKERLDIGLVPKVAYTSHYEIIFHEYGHILFDRLNLSGNPEVKELLKSATGLQWKEAASQISMYATDGIEEYFSEAFLTYFKNGNKLESGMQRLIELALELKL